MKKGIICWTVVLILSACCDRDNISDNIKNLHSSSAKQRNDAALALAQCGEAANKAVPRLASLIYDENIGVQSSAAYALRKIDTPLARKILKEAQARKKGANR